MKIKIVSDGTRAGTTIVNAETNELLEGVRSFVWSLSATNEWDDGGLGLMMSKVVITVYGVKVEAQLEAELSK